MEGELGRGRDDELLDEVGGEPDSPRGAVDGGAGVGQAVHRAVAEDLEPDLLEDPERCSVDVLDVIRREHLERREWVDERPERQLSDAAGSSPRPATTGDGVGRHRAGTESERGGVGNIGWRAC